MRIGYPRVFPLALLTVLGGLVWWLNATSSFSFSSPKLNPQVPDLTAFQVVGVRFNQQGRPFNKLTSSELRHYQADNLTWLTFPNLEYTVEGKPKVTISSTKAKLMQNTNELCMYDKVTLVREAFANKPRVTINGANVLVKINDETAQSSSPILAVVGENRISAVGFYFDNKNEILSLHDQVKVSYVKEK